MVSEERSTATKECPMCGGLMRLSTRERPERVPGTTETHTPPVKEWTCPECDYFEEALEDET